LLRKRMPLPILMPIAEEHGCWGKEWGSSDVRGWWAGLNHHERLSLKRTPKWLRKHLDTPSDR
jgi:hypothetical protein